MEEVVELEKVEEVVKGEVEEVVVEGEGEAEGEVVEKSF